MRRMRPAEVERLYGLFGHKVFMRSLSLLKEEQAAMDTVQEVFGTLLDRFIGFPDDRRAAAWLLKVATNKSFNELRRRKYWRTSPIVREGDEGSTNPFPQLDDRLLLEKVLLSFSARKAPIVVGYFLEGRTLDEVAKETGFSVPTVRRTIAAFLERAKARAGTGNQV